MTLFVEYEAELDLRFEYEPLIKECVTTTLDFVQCPYDVDVSIILTDNKSIREVNKQQRGIDTATDVLSFPMIDFKKPAEFDFLEEIEDCFHPDTGELLLGDIMISVEKVITQAEEYGHTKERELGFLVVHSILHLIGYDHMENFEREEMEQKQREILNRMGIVR